MQVETHPLPLLGLILMHSNLKQFYAGLIFNGHILLHKFSQKKLKLRMIQGGVKMAKFFVLASLAVILFIVGRVNAVVLEDK